MSSSIECQQESGTASRCLPVELLVIVAEFLTGDLCFRTVANLNATCNIVHQETLPVLFETTIWSYERDAELRLEGIVKERGEHVPDYRKYVKYLVIEHLPPRTKFPVKRIPFDRHLPNVKFVLLKLLHPETVPRRSEWVPPDMWIDCALVLFASTQYTTLLHVLHVLASSRLSRGFYSDRNIRHESYDPEHHTAGAYIPDRIGYLTLKQGAVLQRVPDDWIGIDYGYMFSRRGLHLVVEEEDSQRIAPETLVQLLRLGRNMDSDSSFTWRLSMTCRSGILPSVFAAAALEMDVEKKLGVTIKNRTTLSDFQRILKISAESYCRSRQVFYQSLNERELKCALPCVDGDEPMDWHDVVLDHRGPEAMFDLLSRKVDEDDQERGTSTVSTEEDDDDDDDGHEYPPRVDTGDKYYIEVYNANIRPGPARPSGQPGLYVLVEREGAFTGELVVISRTLYS